MWRRLCLAIIIALPAATPSEFKNPAKDTPRALIASGILCIVIFALVPLAFQASLGLEAMMDPEMRRRYLSLKESGV